MMKKAILVVVAASCLLLAGCGLSGKKTNKALAPTNKTHSQIVMLMAGKIDADAKADLAAKIPARVAAVTVDVGSLVRQGQVLVNLDVADLQSQQIQAEAGVNTTRFELAQKQSGSRPEQIIQAKAALESANQAYEIAKNNHQRMSELFKIEMISKTQYETAQAQLKGAEAQYVAAKSQLAILQQGETKEALDVAKAKVRQAQSGLNVINAQLRNGSIVAPISGVVSAKNINPGEMATVGTTLLQIVNLNSLYISAYLPSRLVSKVRVGQNVTVKVAELQGRQFPGVVSVISAAINPTNKSVLVKVKLIKPDSFLKPGMFAQIGLKTEADAR
jgi:HlyD family secretion protein